MSTNICNRVLQACVARALIRSLAPALALTVAFTLALALAGCAYSTRPTAGDATTPTLERTTWKLATLAGEPVTAPDGERAPTLFLDPSDHRAFGSGGCNRFSGSYTLEGGNLGIGPLVSTKMYCEGVMDQEAAYFAALEATRGWRVSARELELTGADGAVLARFEVEPAR